MSRGTAVAGLALRELWMSFRLFVVLVAFVAVGVGVSLARAPLPDLLDRLALGIGAAIAVAAGIAAWSVAVERRTGRAGWLVARDVPRGTYLNGWFGALAGTAVVAHLVATALGWASATAVAPRLELAAYLAAAGATLASSVAGVALGVLVGTMLGPVPALVVTLGLAAVVGGVVLAGAGPAEVVPIAGPLGVLAGLHAGAPAGPALVAGGVTLAAAAVLLAAARLAIERVGL